MSENLNLKTITTIDPSPFKHLCVTIGELPSSFLESMSYYELLAWFVNYLESTIIPAVNANGEATAELQEKFIELKTFVDTYFDNLDVQEEINNKLDEMAADGQLADIISQYLNSTAIFAFDNVASMKSAANLTNGSFARTLGYYSKNDDGGGLYKIRTITNEDVVDDALIIALDDPTLVAEFIVVDNQVNIRQFGAKGNGTDDDTTHIQKALSSNIDKIYVPEGTYLITSKLTMPLNKTLFGCNANTCILKVSDFDDYALQYGVSYVYGSKRGRIKDIRIETNDANNAPHSFGIYVNSGVEIENVYLNHLKQGISKPNSYIDNLIIRRCHIMYCGGRENKYVVELKGNGDACRITQCQFGTAYTQENYNEYLGILIQSSTGFLIDNNIINAPITIRHSVATLLNNHIEGPSTTDHFNLSNINISNSNVSIDTLYIHKCINKPEIAIQQEDANESHNAQVSLKNITIVLSSLMYPYYQSMQDMYDLYIGRQVIVNIENCVNQIDYSAGWSPTKPATGLIVKNENGLLDEFNKVSSIASIKSTISMYKVYIPELNPVTVGATNNSLGNSATNAYTPWFESGYNNSTVYYRRITCYDWGRKLAASVSSEKAVSGITSYSSPQSIGKGVALASTTSYVNATVGCGIVDIIYRGDSSASYNKITKMPVVCGRALYDFGTHIAGVATENRTAGDIDAFTVVENFKRFGNNVEFTSNSLPAQGEFVAGDKCYRKTIAGNGNIGWVYNGSTWVSLGTYPE